MTRIKVKQDDLSSCSGIILLDLASVHAKLLRRRSDTKETYESMTDGSERINKNAAEYATAANHEEGSKLLSASLTSRVIRCFYDAYNELGGGFLATKIEVGLLFNFGPKAQFKRAGFANSRKNLRISVRSAANGFGSA